MHGNISKVQVGAKFADSDLRFELFKAHDVPLELSSGVILTSPISMVNSDCSDRMHHSMGILLGEVSHISRSATIEETRHTLKA